MSKAKPEKKSLPKRFYTAVGVQQNGDGFCITLDGKILRTQGRNLLQLSDAALVQQIAAEWVAQAQHIDPDQMPLTRLVNLAIDRALHERSAWLHDIVGFAGTDLLCYRAPTKVLQQRQATAFDPLLAWATTLGIALDVTEGVMPIAQPQESLARLAHMLENANDYVLAALAMMTPLLGSALLTLALWKQRITVEEALTLCRLDEDFQAEQWGRDELADAAWATKQRDVRATAVFLGAHHQDAQR